MDVVDAIGRTPLIQLKRVTAGLSVPVFVKCEHLNPGGSVKDRTARAIIFDAEARGLLRPHQSPPMTIIEGTAGNTGVGLAVIAASRGYRLIVVIPERVAVDKRIQLTQLGAEVFVAKAAPLKSPDNFRNVAARMAEENGWFLANQFHNPANLDAHYQHERFSSTGVEILEQLAQLGIPLGAFVSSSGTGGTISGVGKLLRERAPGAKVVLSDPTGSSIADYINTGTLGEVGPYVVEGIGSATVAGNLHRDVIDWAEKVPDSESLAMTERLVAEEGLPVGGSSGVNVVGALRVAARGDIQGAVVTIACDQWDRYRSTAWMKAWEARAAARVTLLESVVPPTAP